MIQFRQKEFIGFLASTAAMVVPGLVQGHNQNKKNAEQQEEFQRQNSKLQEKQNEAMNRIAKAAEKDPAKAQAVVNLQQKTYAAGLGKIIKIAVKSPKRAGQVVYDFARGIGAEKMAKTLGSGVAMGATMAGGSYLFDKAIQKDRARITGNAPLQISEKTPEEKRAERNKRIRKAAIGATAVAGSVLAARKGVLGKGFENLSKGLTRSGNPINKKALYNTVKTNFRNGMSLKSVLGGLGFASIFTLPGYIGERKQLKDQTLSYNQQKQYSEEDSERTKGSFLKKAAIGTAATVGAVATLRRVGPAGIRKSLNTMYMTYGNKLSGKSGVRKSIGEWMKHSGSNQYGKAQAQVAQRALKDRISAGADAAKRLNNTKRLERLKSRRFRNDPEGYNRYIEKLKNLADEKKMNRAKTALDNFNFNNHAALSGNKKLQLITSDNPAISRVHGQRLGEGFLGGLGSIMGGVGKKPVTGFLSKMAKSKNEDTKKMAEWLMQHKRTALAGGVGVGLVAFKPFTMGENATRKVIGSVDKNAFAYEKSKEQAIQ